MYAIVRTGGKQYRVEEGRSVVVERLPAEEGETVELKDVLLIAENGDVTIGSPLIEGARVLAEVESNGRHKKIIVFKYKAKVRTRKKTGHRQNFTKLSVTEILLPGQEPKQAEKPKRRRAKAAEAEEQPAEAEVMVEAPVAEPETEAPVAEPAVEEKPKRTRRATPKAGAAEEKPKATRSRRKPTEPKAGTEEKPKRRSRRKADEDKTE